MVNYRKCRREACKAVSYNKQQGLYMGTSRRMCHVIYPNKEIYVMRHAQIQAKQSGHEKFQIGQEIYDMHGKHFFISALQFHWKMHRSCNSKLSFANVEILPGLQITNLNFYSRFNSCSNSIYVHVHEIWGLKT